METVRRGLFVAFEGGDGSGKSTQVGLLAERLRDAGWPVTVTREPGSGHLGGRIRELLLHGDAIGERAEALLFAADRAEHVATVVRPALEGGHVVITDRYMDSSIAYQGAGRHLGIEQVRALSMWATNELLPDLTVLLDAPLELATARRTGRTGQADRMEAEEADFHQRVREGFVALAQADPGRYLVLDASRPLDGVAADVLAAVTERLDSLGTQHHSGATQSGESGHLGGTHRAEPTQGEPAEHGEPARQSEPAQQRERGPR